MTGGCCGNDVQGCAGHLVMGAALCVVCAPVGWGRRPRAHVREAAASFPLTAGMT